VELQRSLTVTLLIITDSSQCRSGLVLVDVLVLLVVVVLLLLLVLVDVVFVVSEELAVDGVDEVMSPSAPSTKPAAKTIAY